MLLTAFAALTFACSPAPTAPEPPDMAPLFNVVLPGGDTLRLTLTYMCGNRWRLRNPHAQPLDVTWDVFRTTARGALTLPARPEGAAFSESFFEMQVAGTTRLFYQTRLVQTKAHRNRACSPSGGRVTIPGPDSFPRKALLDSMPRLRFGTSPDEIVYAGLVDVRFRSSASLLERQAIVDSIGATVVGGWSGVTYMLRLQPPWTEERLRSTLARLERSAVIAGATAVYRSLPDEPSWLRPDEGNAAWNAMALVPDAAEGLNGALESIRGPLACGGVEEVPVAVM